MKQFGIQMWTVRDLLTTEEDFAVTVKKMAEMGYKEAHTAGCRIDPKRYIDILKGNGMSICGTHYPLSKMEEDVKGTVEFHRLWETTNIGIGGLDEAERTDLAKLKAFVKKYNELAKIYASEGFKLTYHNHAFEFNRIDGKKTVMDILYEELDPHNISFVLDTCWVQVGGADVRYWIEKLVGRLDILHLKDCMAVRDESGRQVQGMTEIGNGNLWIEGIIESAEKAGVKHYIVEQDTCPGNPLDSIRQSADYLKKLIK